MLKPPALAFGFNASIVARVFCSQPV
jgi:hypothetical protein